MDIEFNREARIAELRELRKEKRKDDDDLEPEEADELEVLVAEQKKETHTSTIKSEKQTISKNLLRPWKTSPTLILFGVTHLSMNLPHSISLTRILVLVYCP